MENLDTDYINCLIEYLKEKYDLNDESSLLLGKLSYGFAKQISNDLNTNFENQDLNSSNLKEILSKRGFSRFNIILDEYLIELRKKKKEQIFQQLQKENFVSKNYHFEFAKLLLSSKHQISNPHISDYSDIE